MPAAQPPTAPAGNLADALSGLFGALGVEKSSTRDTVVDAISAALAERGHRAEVVELRYGTLTLRADPLAAKLLGYDRDQLLAALETAVPGVVTALRVRTR